VQPGTSHNSPPPDGPTDHRNQDDPMGSGNQDATYNGNRVDSDDGNPDHPDDDNNNEEVEPHHFESSLEDFQLANEFIHLLRHASLDDEEERLDPETLHRLRNPLCEPPTLDADQRLSIDIFLAVTNASEQRYADCVPKPHCWFIVGWQRSWYRVGRCDLAPNRSRFDLALNHTDPSNCTEILLGTSLPPGRLQGEFCFDGILIFAILPSTRSTQASGISFKRLASVFKCAPVSLFCCPFHFSITPLHPAGSSSFRCIGKTEPRLC
jgi:hypothetical protein